MTDRFAAWEERIAWACVVGCVVGGVAWMSWLTVMAVNTANKPSREEMQQASDRMYSVVEKNTAAYHDLRLELTKLRTVLDERDK